MLKLVVIKKITFIFNLQNTRRIIILINLGFPKPYFCFTIIFYFNNIKTKISLMFLLNTILTLIYYLNCL